MVIVSGEIDLSVGSVYGMSVVAMSVLMTHGVPIWALHPRRPGHRRLGGRRQRRAGDPAAGARPHRHPGHAEHGPGGGHDHQRRHGRAADPAPDQGPRPGHLHLHRPRQALRHDPDHDHRLSDRPRGRLRRSTRRTSSATACAPWAATPRRPAFRASTSSWSRSWPSPSWASSRPSAAIINSGVPGQRAVHGRAGPGAGRHRRHHPGGASLSGGEGTIVGTLIGVLLLGVLRNGLVLLGVSPFVQMVLIGAVLIGAVALDMWSRRK